MCPKLLFRQGWQKVQQLEKEFFDVEGILVYFGGVFIVGLF